MRVSLKLTIAAAVAVPTLLAFGAQAGASTATASVSASAVPATVANTTAATKLPRSNIAKGNVFKPTSLSAAGHAGTKCSKKTAGAIVVNKTTTNKQLTSGGSNFGPVVPPGAGLYVCYIEKGVVPPPTTLVLGIKNKTSTLTISFT
jgi:hypothetical protein